MVDQTSYYKGIAAEAIVAVHYKNSGYQQKAKRMKTSYGEVDLVMEKQNQWVFIEVKYSKTIAQAVVRITQRQIERLYAAAEMYLAKLDLLGVVDCRFDAAFVDEKGNVEIVENAFI